MAAPDAPRRDERQNARLLGAEAVGRVLRRLLGPARPRLLGQRDQQAGDVVLRVGDRFDGDPAVAGRSPDLPAHLDRVAGPAARAQRLVQPAQLPVVGRSEDVEEAASFQLARLELPRGGERGVRAEDQAVRVADRQRHGRPVEEADET
ncbi:hypothetical protein GCM10020254_14940 [Streptomyces goshikiensis]